MQNFIKLSSAVDDRVSVLTEHDAENNTDMIHRFCG